MSIMMDSANTLGRSNPLIQRVRRHAEMAVLFRSAESTPAVSPLSGLPVTQAIWPSTSLVGSLPIGQAIEPAVQPVQRSFTAVPTAVPASSFQPTALQPVLTASTAVPTPPIAPTASVFRQEATATPPALTSSAQPSAIRPEVTAVSRPSAPSSASVFRQETSTVSTPIQQPTHIPPQNAPETLTIPVDMSQSVTEDEPTWRRLQTIYNRHQDRLAEEETAKQETAVSPPPIQRTSAPTGELIPKVPLPEAPPPSRPRPVPLATPSTMQPAPTLSRQSENTATTPNLPVPSLSKAMDDKGEATPLKVAPFEEPPLKEVVQPLASEGVMDKAVAEVSRKTTADSGTSYTANVIAPTMTTEGGATITSTPTDQSRTPATAKLEEISHLTAPTVIGNEEITPDKPTGGNQTTPVLGDVAARTVIDEPVTPLAHEVPGFSTVDETRSHVEDTVITNSAVSGIPPSVQKKATSESSATAKVEPSATNQPTVSASVSHLAEPMNEQMILSSSLVMPKREKTAAPEMVSPIVPSGITSPKTTITDIELGPPVSAPVSHLAEPLSEQTTSPSSLVMPKREGTAVPETISPTIPGGMLSPETSITSVESGETVTVFNKLDDGSGSESSEPTISERVTPPMVHQSASQEPSTEVQRAAESTLPLEAAWPVQRQKTQPESVSAIQLAPTEQPIVDYPAEEAKKVQAALNKVSAGQPTDSSVELVLPRRPRPGGLPTSSPTIQRQPEYQTTADSPNPQAAIPTEIGPLPPDLWQIIGQKPPTAASQPPVTAGQPSPTPQPPVMRQPETAVFTPSPILTPIAPSPAPITADIMPATAVTRQPAGLGKTPQGDFSPSRFEPALPAQSPTLMQNDYLPDMIQLADEPPASAPPPAAASTEGGAAGKTAEVDIDAVARRVYSDLKRRLVVEWERVRGKF